MVSPRRRAGHANAQAILGAMYAEGKGVPQDDAEAVKWCRLAADQGNYYAQRNLAISYAKGEGVPQDYVQAHMWINLAASRIPASEVKRRSRNAAARNAGAWCRARR